MAWQLTLNTKTSFRYRNGITILYGRESISSGAAAANISSNATSFVDTNTNSTGQIPVADTSIGIFPERIANFFDSFHGNETETQWLRSYLAWHNEMRDQYPGISIFTHPDAPKTFIYYFSDGTGGLNDRIKLICGLLRVCDKQRRLLFIKWFKPMDIESFLEPNLFNWTLPMVPNITDSPTSIINFKSKFLKKMDVYEKGKGKYNRKDYDHQLSVIFHAFFRPSDAIQLRVQAAFREMDVQPFHYDAIHMRVGHPSFSGLKKTRDFGNINRFEDNPVMCLRDAAKAIQCAKQLALSQSKGTNVGNRPSNESTPFLPIYFFSDSSELVQTVTHPPVHFQPFNTSPAESQLQAFEELKKALNNGRSDNNTHNSAPIKIVSRENATVTHISGDIKKKGLDKDNAFEAFASTFVDLYIASQARCINLGVGNFAYLAFKIKLQNDEEYLGQQEQSRCWAVHHPVTSQVALQWAMHHKQGEVPRCDVSSKLHL